jgi:predicted small lipoprotein YifL
MEARDRHFQTRSVSRTRAAAASQSWRRLAVAVAALSLTACGQPSATEVPAAAVDAAVKNAELELQAAEAKKAAPAQGQRSASLSGL